MVECGPSLAPQRKSGTDETTFLPTASNADHRRGSLQLNEYEAHKINAHLESMLEAGALPWACEFLAVDKTLLDLLRPPSEERAAPPSKLSMEMKELFYLLREMEAELTTRMGTMADDEWPPSVTNTEYTQYKLRIGTDTPEPKSLAEIRNSLKSYSCPSHAIADAYDLLEKDFRFLVPGSARWLNRVSNLREFQSRVSLIASKRGDGIPLDTPLMKNAKRASTVRSGFSPLPKSVKEKSGPGPRPRAPRASPKIEPEEYAAMQSLLNKLGPTDALDLYEQFQHTACWTGQGEGGEQVVELDDENTQPKVFREMLKWCTGRIGM